MPAQPFDVIVGSCMLKLWLVEKVLVGVMIPFSFVKVVKSVSIPPISTARG